MRVSMRHTLPSSLSPLARRAAIVVVGFLIAATTIATSPVDPPILADAGDAPADAGVSNLGWTQDLRHGGELEAGEHSLILRLYVQEELLTEIGTGQLGVRVMSTDPSHSVEMLDVDGAAVPQLDAQDAVTEASGETISSGVLTWTELGARCRSLPTDALGFCSIDTELRIRASTPVRWSAQGFVSSSTGARALDDGRLIFTVVR